jgi:hypothetical protein
MSATREWEKFYRAAILETDRSKIDESIRQAEAAIKGRLQEFSLDHGGTTEENRAIEQALRGLTALRQDVTAYKKRRS